MLTLSQIKKLHDRLDKLVKKNYTNSNLNFYKGKLFWLEFLHSTKNTEDPYLDLVFYSIINKEDWKEQVCFSCIENAITYIRRALSFQVYFRYKIEAKLLLSNLYLWLDTYRWKEAYRIASELPSNFQKYLGKNAKYYHHHSPEFILNVYYILFPSNLPNWKKMSEFFPEKISIDFLKGCSYFVRKNTPSAFSYLQKVVENTNKQISIFQKKENIKKPSASLLLKNKHKAIHDTYESLLYSYRNSALYLLGLLYKNFYKKNVQLSYYSLIDLDFFISQNYWFLEEIYNLYTYVGEKKQATAIFNKYRK